MKNKLIATILIASLIGLPLKPLLAIGEEIVYIGEDTILSEDINGRVIITADNIILDCNGHKIIGSGIGYSRGDGIYLYEKDN